MPGCLLRPVHVVKYDNVFVQLDVWLEEVRTSAASLAECPENLQTAQCHLRDKRDHMMPHIKLSQCQSFPCLRSTLPP